MIGSLAQLLKATGFTKGSQNNMRIFFFGDVHTQ